MLKIKSLVTILFVALYACSAGAFESPDKFLSQIARKLDFTGLVDGHVYQYKIMRNYMNKYLEIIGESDNYQWNSYPIS